MRFLLCLLAAAAVASAASPGSPTEPQRHLRDPVPDTTRDNGGSPRPGQSRESKYNVCCRFNAEKTKCDCERGTCLTSGSGWTLAPEGDLRLTVCCGKSSGHQGYIVGGYANIPCVKEPRVTMIFQCNSWEVGIEPESIGTEPDSGQGDTYSDFSVGLSILDAFSGYYDSEVREAYINFIVDYCNH